MSTSSINSLSSSYIQSILNSVLQKAGTTIDQANNSLASISGSSTQTQDSNRLSPFAQMISELQQLQQSDPAKYKQVTQQIATNLTTAAQTATKLGNTTVASELTQLATDFTNASTSGQLPSISDLAKAIGGHHHHHPHGGHFEPASDSTASSASSGIQTTPAHVSALDPMTIILNTLAGAGIGGSASA